MRNEKIKEFRKRRYYLKVNSCVYNYHAILQDCWRNPISAQHDPLRLDF